MLQAASIGLFKLLAPKPHNSDCQNLFIPLQIKPVQKSVTASFRFLILVPLALMGEDAS